MANKILIIRFSSIGDIVLTSPVIRCLKTQVPDTEIHFCTKPQFATLLKSNPYIDKIHLLDGSLGSLISKLRKERFNVVIDLHHNLRTRLIKTALGVKSYSFDKLNFEKWLLVNFKINRLPNKHIVDRYMQTVAPLGVKMDALGLDYFIPESEDFDPAWLPFEFRDGFVVFAIGGQHNTKKLPLSRMIELCDKINKPIVLIGGKEDLENGQQISEFFARPVGDEAREESLGEMNKKTVIFNLCGKLSIHQSAGVIKRAKYVFTHDTGMMHIAAAFQKQIYSIWGNTLPAFGMYPYRSKFVVLENSKLSCRPCSKIGFSECPKGHFNCMNKIVFDFWLP
jgi:ADP-heptose:LPS heptosyltransferase